MTSYRRNKAHLTLIRDLLTRGLPLKEVAAAVGLGTESFRKYYGKEIQELRPDPHKVGHRFVATSEQRKLVQQASAYGMPPAEIAALIGPDGISEQLLRREFAAELKVGRSKATFQVAHAIYRMATGWMAANSGKGAEPNRVNIDAAKFFAERRMGWQQKTAVDLHMTKQANEYTDDELAAIAAGGGSEPDASEESED